MRHTRNNKVEVNHQTVSLSNTGIKLRIAALSDLHPRTLSFPVSKLIKLANEQNPDIFVLAGDIVERPAAEDFVESFRSVKANKAKLAVLGNSEYNGKLDKELLRKKYAQVGFHLLVNEIVEIDGVSIVGLDDYVRGSPDFDILQKADVGSNPVIWISHCPKSFDSISLKYNAPTLMLSGHTHGGQIAPFGITLITPYGSGSYKKGWYKKRQHLLYVMRGIGTSRKFPFRIGVKPEILVLDIE